MRIIIAGIVCLMASSLSASNLFDTVQSLRQQTWESEYIPESTIPVIPLTDYDEFEVVELFRTETIEELEASLTSGYPYPWLEETLKDESIPWEDRYWLDRRVRAAISQNLHTFFDTEGNPVHVDADEVFPGEWYWREHMIVDPEGRYAAEDAVRPVLPKVIFIDAGYILNTYGYRMGEIAVAMNGLSLSRDASIGVIAMGNEGIDDLGCWNVQYYANLLYPDGSFKAIQFDELGIYSGTISADGNVLVFFHKTRYDEDPGSVVIMDRNGTIQKRIPSEFHFSRMFKPPISYNGHFASCETRHPERHSAIADYVDGDIYIDTEHTGSDRNTDYCTFSPDGNFLCIGGLCKGRVVDLRGGSEYVYPETAPREDYVDQTRVSCSNSRIVTAIIVTRRSRGQFNYVELNIYINDTLACTQPVEIGRTSIQAPEVSPNGHYLLMNPLSSGGECRIPMPLLVMNVQGAVI